MKLLIVGDCPSRLNSSANVAFVGAKCEPRLREWLRAWDAIDAKIVNSVTETDWNTISSWIGPIVALGAKAQSRLEARGITHLKIGHPSGLNRKWNSKYFEHSEIERVKSELLSTIGGLGRMENEK